MDSLHKALGLYIVFGQMPISILSRYQPAMTSYAWEQVQSIERKNTTNVTLLNLVLLVSLCHCLLSLRSQDIQIDRALNDQTLDFTNYFHQK